MLTLLKAFREFLFLGIFVTIGLTLLGLAIGKRKERPVIDRRKYNTPEYRAKLAAAAEQLAANEEYQKEIAAWQGIDP